MSLEHINQLLKNKDWARVAQTLESVLASPDSDEGLVLNSFEKIPSAYREENCFNLFLKLWKPAMRAGKLKIAKDYARVLIQHLLKLKRFPYLLNLIQEFREHGLTKISYPEADVEIISGKCSLEKFNPLENWNLVSLHPEKWRTSQAFLKNYLLQNDEWKIDEWKFAYEYILNFHFDADLFQMIQQRAYDMDKKEHAAKIGEYLLSKGVGAVLNGFGRKIQPSETKSATEMKINYDDLALNLISGELVPSPDEQKKVLFSLKDLSESELKAKGKDMIVAFSLLGMEEVVLYLCKLTIPLINDLKTKISLHYTCAQTLFDKGNYHSLIDYVDDMTESEPLLSEERIAFDYLKAEALLKLKRTKQANTLFSKIKKINPHFRLVNQRLKESEAIK